MSATFDEETVARLHEELGSDVASMKEIVEAFLQDAPKILAAGSVAAAARNAEGVLRAAHTLRSSAALLGAARLAELCRALEANAAGGGGPFDKEVEAIKDEFARVRPLMAAWASTLT